MSEGWIYFVRDGNFVKVGFTTMPRKRASHRRTENPNDLETMLMFQGDKSDEARIHKVWRDYRFRGEWFKYEGEFKEMVDECAAQCRREDIERVRLYRLRYLAAGEKGYERQTEDERARKEFAPELVERVNAEYVARGAAHMVL